MVNLSLTLLLVEHTQHTDGGRTRRGPWYGGRREECKEGSNDRSDRSDTNVFSDGFGGLSSSMVPTASSWEDMEASSLSFFSFESLACTAAATPTHAPQVCMYFKNYY